MRLLSRFTSLESIQVGIDSAFGKILAQTIRAPFSIPGFNNSSMDGFAVKAIETTTANRRKPVLLKVVSDIPAGHVPSNGILKGQAARVMTGAPIPDGADAVVPLEETDSQLYESISSMPAFINIYSKVLPGDYIRPMGQDVRQGEIILEPGKRLRPQEVGFLAMCGISRVWVYQSPRVAFFSSGDELVGIDKQLEFGQVYDANSYMLNSLIVRNGAQAIHLGIARDSSEAVKQILDQAVDFKVDLIISTAGVSVGAYDYVRHVMERDGKLEFWRINMRPGKPLAFGNYQDIPFLGLPGNPVSAFVGFEVFARPAILKMSGDLSLERKKFKVQLAEAVTSDGRESYLRAQVWDNEGRLMAKFANHQGSGNLYSLVQANAFLIVPSGVKSLPIGAELDAWLFDESIITN